MSKEYKLKHAKPHINFYRDYPQKEVNARKNSGNTTDMSENHIG
jgi:hypothetical protein